MEIAGTCSKMLMLIFSWLVTIARAGATSVPLPLSIAPSFNWEGDDGRWSTFLVQVGTPGQGVRLLPCTSASAGAAIWVVTGDGCSTVNPNLTNCPDTRGRVFETNQSTTWSTEHLANGVDGAIYSLEAPEESLLGLDANASYGFDTLALGLPGSGMPTLNHQVIAGIWSNTYFLGSLGLSNAPSNFSDFNEPQQSMLSTLVNESLIPSASWAYTAGASYYEPPAFGSLTLGGYDTTRFELNNVTFTFGADFSRDLLVSLQSITYNTLGSSPLMTSSIDVFIDSLVPEIWLPIDVCQAFEKQFNLTWNEQGKVYLVSDVAHAALLEQNPEFIFTIGHAGYEGGETVEIAFPYSAFDMNLTMPITEASLRYFPLKQAQNSTQYTLGRTFFQEAYVITDYARRNFSVSKALFPNTSVLQNLVAIHNPESDKASSTHLSIEVIAGIVIAVVVLLAATATIVVIVIKRKRREEEARVEGDVRQEPWSEPFWASEVDGGTTEVYEFGCNSRNIPELASMGQVRSELDSHNSRFRHELETREIIHELEGRGG